MHWPATYELVNCTLVAANVFLREGGRFFRPYGLTSAQFNVLNVLGDHPEGLSQRELGEILVVDRSNITGLLDRVQRAGWVRRESVAEDRRRHRVRLTPEGTRLLARVRPAYARALADFAARIEGDVPGACRVLATAAESAPRWQES